jgi:hypothetical protein
MSFKKHILLYWEDFCWECNYYIGQFRWHIRHSLNCTIKKYRLGFNPEDIWNLDISIARYILPRLKYLKRIKLSHPSRLSEKQWDREISKMIRAFELIANDTYFDYGDGKDVKRRSKIINDGLASFIKHYHSLWT